MPKIYQATPKSSSPFIEEKIKHIVVKDGEVKIIDNSKYIPDSSSDFTFEVGKSHAKDLKKCIEKNFGNFNTNFPEKFLELLNDQFDIQEEEKQENPIQFILPQPDKEEKELLAAIPSASSTPTFSRPMSVKFGNPPANFAELKKTLSHPDLSVEDSSKTSSLESLAFSKSRNSIYSQDSLEQDQANQSVQAERICTFFNKISNLDPLENIKNHGEQIKKGYFNGKEKSEILLSIFNLVEKIKVTSLNLGQQATPEKINELKKDISTLDLFINDKINLDKLSRYRGFSSFKCFATLWGGGKLTSMEYVNQLRKELNPLIDEVLSNRPAI